MVIEPDPGDIAFRSLAAPGLDEDDLFAAMHGLPGRGVFWGEGRPAAFGPPERAWNPADERRERHQALLRKWGTPPV